MGFKRSLLLVSLLSSPCLAERAGVVGEFRGLHNSESSILINDNEAQDLSNVDISENGKTVRKREGTATFKSVGIATHPVTGGYYFKDVDGDSILVAANDGSVYKSESSGAFSAFVTTDTSGAFYDFVDSQGFIWRANSANDEIWKYNGTTLTYYPNHPKGNQIESLPDRLVISGSTSAPNRLYFSGAADFTDFTTGLLDTSPFTEDMFLPGQNITAIKAACGGVIAWTADTMSFWYGNTQYDGQIKQISQNIGTRQPSSVVEDLGSIYWQAQDGHFYSYDCNSITRLSANLDVSDFVNGSPKTWNQTSQADWTLGTLTYTSKDIAVGDVVLSTWTDTDTTTADFTAGTTSNTSVINDRVYLSTNDTNVLNNSFETQDASYDPSVPSNWGYDNVTYFPVRLENGDGQLSNTCGAITARTGTWILLETASSGSSSHLYADILNVGGSIIETFDLGTWDSFTQCSWTAATINTSSYAGRWVKLKIRGPTASASAISDVFLGSGSSTTLYINTGIYLGIYRFYVDDVSGGRSTTYSGTFTSAAFDTAFSTAAWLASSVTSSSNSHSITWQTQSSPDGSTWDSASSWTPGAAPASDWDRYIRYVVTMSTGGTTDGTALPYVEDVTLSARASSGTIVSQTKEIGANATSFGNFTRDETLNSGTIGYFIRTATTEGGLAAASWTAMTADAQISATILPWIQVKATFTITTATYDPTLSAFSINWNEGAITRHCGVVDKDHRIMWSIAEDADTVPSVSYLYDQRFGSWLKYSFPFYAPARFGDQIYYGSPSAGTVFQYPSGTSDSGSAITAYWKSKDFVGTDPFVEKNFSTCSLNMKAETGSNIDFSYTLDTTSTVSLNISLTDPNGATVRRKSDWFPSGTVGSFINFKFGNDDADAPFELFGFVFDFTPRPWRVME